MQTPGHSPEGVAPTRDAATLAGMAPTRGAATSMGVAPASGGAGDVATPRIGGVFHWVMPVRWGDLDALNHVNNTLYFRYAEEARVCLFAQAGIILPSTRVGVLAHASLDFLKPLRYPSTAVVRLTLARIGRSSMELDMSIECEEDPGTIYAKGKNIMVGTDSASGKSSPWTASELAGFAHCFV
jgi:acyl-CoA thioester hydrolase